MLSAIYSEWDLIVNYADGCYAEYRYVSQLIYLKLSVIMLNVIMSSFIMLSVIIFIVLSVMLSVMMLSVIMLSGIMLSVEAPWKELLRSFGKYQPVPNETLPVRQSPRHLASQLSLLKAGAFFVSKMSAMTAVAKRPTMMMSFILDLIKKTFFPVLSLPL